MNGSSSSAARFSAVGRAPARIACALGGAALLLAGALPARAAPPSAIVVEHLVAQAGLSVVFGLNQTAVLFNAFDGANGSCTPDLGNNVFTFGRDLGAPGGTMLVFGVYYDAACTVPYYTDTVRLSGSANLSMTSKLEFDAPNGAILGVLSLAQHFQNSASSEVFGGKGTYKAVAGVGEPPVRVGLACSESGGGSTTTFVCQEGVAQDFPSLKMALGTIANLNFTLTEVSSTVFKVQMTGANAKLATGKLGGLSIAQTSLTTLGFQGAHTVVGTGSLSGSSPAFSAIPPTGSKWSFSDAQHATKFSLSTAFDLISNGKVVNGKTHATAVIKADKSGTGTITYSDKSTAKIANWTLSD